MHLLNVAGRDREFVNLDLVKRIKTEDFGQEAELTFVYTDGSEDSFSISSGRLRVLRDMFVERSL